ncbi:Surface polysaccharide O-acyltransferase, integral membrane enzyme [Oscillibacter sp. PC13]|uniref:acyltransferase n=1 Tax=Oscillibacter sp. PC13 TaxID=1855299 RepID=UPI0008EF2A86|nr:acyltransferase family protein [Oscillibacter sp. PC13]SFP39980.1 Surface polysaccharide O-acyltransferase, integral membrane enzyme [Oscillibacter sp. PC13]
MKRESTPVAAPTPTRNQTVDLVKAVAIASVLLIHVSAGGLGGEVGSAEWISCLFWGSVSRAAVPLFLMASGALLLDPARDLTLKKLYTKNFLRLVAALLFWAVCYKVFHLLVWGQMTVSALVQAAKEIFLFRHEEHLYYLHIMLLVYAFLPATRLVAAHAGRRQIEYLLGLWFLLGILYPTVKPFWPFTLLVGIPAQWLMNMTYASIGYTLLGHYLSVYYTHSRQWIWTAMAGFLLTFGGTWAASEVAGKLDPHFLEGMGVGVCLLAVGIYGLCQSVFVSERAEQALAYISKASFCVFLTHIFFLKTFACIGLSAQAGPAVFTVPLLSALLLGCGCAAYAVLSRIPGVRRWLI